MTKTERLDAMRQQIAHDKERAAHLHDALSAIKDRELWLLVFEQCSTLEEFIKRSEQRLKYEELT